jgi:hypothetical protein
MIVGPKLPGYPTDHSSAYEWASFPIKASGAGAAEIPLSYQNIFKTTKTYPLVDIEYIVSLTLCQHKI